MNLDRRQFFVVSATVLPGQLFGAQQSSLPWHQKVRRVGQVNMNERDPVELDVEAWAEYWSSLKVDAVQVSVTGILAFYPTKVPYHRRSAFLGERDFFGHCCAAAKKRGIRVLARMSPDLQWEEAVRAHPEWFERNAQGEFVRHNEDGRLFRTCMFSTYFTEQIPAIMREVNSRYDVDGIFTNAWPPLGRIPVCYCDQCRRSGSSRGPAGWDRFNERVLYLWKLFDSIAKEKKPDNLYFGNLGGSIRAAPNLKKLGEVCHWFNCDNQGRGGDDTPVWGCAMQGRVCQSVMKGKTSTNVTGAWSTGSPRWRNVAKSPAESEIWMDQTVASGMVVWYHWVGGQKGLGEDRRWHEPGRRYFQWLARHDQHFLNKRTIANLGVVLGQRNNLFYTPPEGAMTRQYMDGLYYALIEGRFLFDFIHEDDLDLSTLQKYSALILPNVAMLSDEQCRQLRDYADSGGSLLATFETSMYDRDGRRRADFGLADVFGIHKAGNIEGPRGNAYYARIEQQHEILQGFSNTNWLPGAEFRLPVKADGRPVLTVVPPYPSYPPELSYAPVPRTDEPAVVIRETGRSRCIYFPGDVERTLWRTGHVDLSRLLQNSVRWLSRGESPVTIQGDGVIESFAWETEPGFTVHLLNYTNPNMHRGWLRQHYPIGEQKVQMKLPPGRKVSRVELLRAETEIRFRETGGTVEFTVPRVLDYEVAALS